MLYVEDGMTTEVEREWLAKRAHGRVAEVGCWKGNTTKYLTKSADVVYAVDVWRLCAGTAHLKELADVPLDYLFLRFMENLHAEILTGLVIPIPMASVEAARYFEPESLDMVFIDADHSYEAVKADILAWRPLVKPNGFFCGHDMTGHPGVERAVTELVPGFKRGPGAIWYV